MYVLKNCEPFIVFKYFEEISRIPRGSGNEKAVSDYIFSFAKERGYFAVQDEMYNLIIKVPASEGAENAPAVIIQGHLDMVCEKVKMSMHDFLTDPIELFISGDYIKAKETTLGADNGIAIAYAMALMELKNYPHPPLEIVLTSSEEVGLDGAVFLSAEHLTAKRLINIDSEEEGILLTSCAGGSKPTISLEIQYAEPPDGYNAYLLSVSGLKGGHSGMEIHKERANANRLMGRVLDGIINDFDIHIESIQGGQKDNAITREAEAVILIKQSEFINCVNTIEEMCAKLKHEYASNDPNIEIAIRPYDGQIKNVFSRETAEKVVFALMLLPNGVGSMSLVFDGLVETSNNIGVVKIENGYIKITCAVRSSVASRKKFVLRQIEQMARFLGADYTNRGEYPSWEYKADSAIRNIFVNAYRNMYGAEPKLEAIHAGVECGLFAEKIEGIDMISFGPNMFDVHTPDEKISISSVKRTWEYLLYVLERLMQ